MKGEESTGEKRWFPALGNGREEHGLEGSARSLSNRVSCVTKCSSNASASDKHKNITKKVNGELVRA